MLSNEIWRWVESPPLLNRGWLHVHRTGEPFWPPDACHHPPNALILMPDEITGEVIPNCWLCGARIIGEKLLKKKVTP